MPLPRSGSSVRPYESLFMLRRAKIPFSGTQKERRAHRLSLYRNHLIMPVDVRKSTSIMTGVT